MNSPTTPSGYTDKLSLLLGRPAAVVSPPIHLRYPSARLRAEGLKGVLGMVFCWGTVLVLDPMPLVAWPLGAIGALSALYAGQQWYRRKSQWAMGETGVGNSGEVLQWNDLDELKLNFYSHGRRSQKGTLVLVLKSHGQKIKLDSSLEGFPTVLVLAATAARKNALLFDPTTSANLEQLGL